MPVTTTFAQSNGRTIITTVVDADSAKLDKAGAGIILNYGSQQNEGETDTAFKKRIIASVHKGWFVSQGRRVDRQDAIDAAPPPLDLDP